jgi:transcriptional regulator with XRE-family HTH domain
MDYRNADIIERIKDIMREESLGQKGLVEATGVVQSSVSAILNGKRSPDPLVNAMSEKMGISKQWLVNGVGLKYENSKIIAEDSKNIASRESLSMEEKVSLMKEMNALYEKHQSLLEEAQNIMKSIVEINKKIILINC